MIDILVRRLARMAGFDVERQRPVLIDLLLRHRVASVLDVGANEGQFGRRLRAWGYRGRLISFEPLPTAFEVLRRRAAGDPLWQVHNLALGDEDGSAVLRIAADSVFSSLREPGTQLQGIFPAAAVRDRQPVTIRRLDSYVEELALVGPLLLKLDVQGYEREVLRGGPRTLRRSAIVQLELPLCPLYEGEASFCDLIYQLEAGGFRLAIIEPVAWDRESDAVLAVDCVFVARGLNAADR